MQKPSRAATASKQVQKDPKQERSFENRWFHLMHNFTRWKDPADGFRKERNPVKSDSDSDTIPEILPVRTRAARRPNTGGHFTAGFSGSKQVPDLKPVAATQKKGDSLLPRNRSYRSRDVGRLMSHLNELSKGMLPLYSFWKSGLCVAKGSDPVIEGVRHKIEGICSSISCCLQKKPKYGDCPNNYMEIFYDHGSVLMGNISNSLRNLQLYCSQPSSHHKEADPKAMLECRQIWGMLLMFFVQFWNKDIRKPCSFWDAWSLATIPTRHQTYQQFMKTSSAMVTWLSSSSDDQGKIAAALESLAEYGKAMMGTVALEETETLPE